MKIIELSSMNGLMCKTDKSLYVKGQEKFYLLWQICTNIAKILSLKTVANFQ